MVETIDIKIEKVTHSRIDQVDFDNIVFGRNFSDHMFTADYKNGEWANFQIVPYQDLKLNPANSALHYGQSIFEGLKAYRNEKNEVLVFRPDQNARRLRESAMRMCMPELPEEIFMTGLNKLLELDSAWVPSGKDKSLYIRPFIFAMDDYLGIRPSDTYKFMIITGPVGAYYSEPVKVKVETRFSRAVEGGTGAAKTAGNYAASLYPAKLAQQQGYHQLIWTDSKEHRYIEESGTMNVMFLIGNKLITANTGDTILHGITRDCALTLARDWGYEVEERRVSVNEIIEAAKNGELKEAFGTGTAATITHIAVISHEGIEYNLPEVGGRTLSNRLLQELDAIKVGITEDKHNWVYRIL
ncbi:branched-chain amino acid aminotransferase [Xanthovirga aplysinae]|uniref:branched-chain amino acid aminotransferase n=1 Tax=Xanthovirga aplysinae TaxID=2529853 RepID=UPI0012BC9ED5|nr:branched-chain amino acid aminotransferase [Xanthovirga aplysinae]MTI33123.1 branched-chain amino acid aminotransferase [Xanthovirga aplysinae]